MARTKSNDTNPSTATSGFEAKLWLIADKLRNNMDAAEYKHVVLGLIFLKYISDTCEEHRAKALAGQGDYAGVNAEDPDEPSGASQPAAGSPKRQCGGAEHYKAENVFWVPADAHWSHLQASAKQPTIGKTVDDAMVAIERDNPRVKGVIPKDYALPGLDKQRLGELSTSSPPSNSPPPARERRPTALSICSVAFMIGAERQRLPQAARRVSAAALIHISSPASPAPRARTAASSTPRPASCAASSRCSPPYKGGIYDPACGSGDMLVRIANSSSVQFSTR